MTKAKAIESAIFRANKYNIPYCIVQAKNGQWMCERLDFVVNNPLGRMIYDKRPKEVYRSGDEQ